jgi:putative ABC transport system substrate-binding protein
MKSTITILALGALLFAHCLSAQAQPQTRKFPLIGVVHTGSSADPVNVGRIRVFRQNLRDLGYLEGKNINVEYRYAEGNPGRLPELAEELVRLKIDILVVSTATAVRAARKVTATIPIVVANMGSLSGLGDSLARPGGNVTGLTHISIELLGKRLELLKEVLPKVCRFAFLDDASGAGGYKNVANETDSAVKA